MNTRAMLRLSLGMVAALAVLAAPGGPLTPAPWALSASASEPEDGGAKRDVVTLRNGRVLEGEILEETATHIRMRVFVGTLSTVTEYPKSDVLHIERGKRAAESPKADTAAATPVTPPANGAATAAATDGEVRVYMFEMKGIFGLDSSQTPFRRVLEDAVSHNPDVIIIKMNTTQDERFGFQGIFRAEDMTRVVEEFIRKGNRIVFWIKEATVGAAFLPFVSPEIYFMSDGRMGGIGTLQDFSVGDKMVTEKMISAFFGHAEGIAITGGYAPELVKAMGRMDYWLAVRFRGGQPVFYCNTVPPPANEDWTILSDDGKGQNKDALEDVVRGRGNDVLNLDADWALRLRVSKGTYGRLEDLVFGLGLGTDYTKIDGRGQRILDDWSTRIRGAIETMDRLQRDYAEVRVDRDNAQQSIGLKMRYLREMRGLLSQFAEVLDTDGSQRSQIDIQLEIHRQEIQDATRRR